MRDWAISEHGALDVLDPGGHLDCKTVRTQKKRNAAQEVRAGAEHLKARQRLSLTGLAFSLFCTFGSKEMVGGVVLGWWAFPGVVKETSCGGEVREAIFRSVRSAWSC